MKAEKIRSFLSRNAGYMIVALVCIVYVATALVGIGETGKSVKQIIADGAVAFCLGFSINRVLDVQGITNGKRDDNVIRTLQVHGETVVKISPYIERLGDWCDIKNAENLKVQRSRILASHGMRYADYFDEDGVAKGITPDEAKLNNKHLRGQEKARIRAYNKAARLKLTLLTADSLTSDNGKQPDQYNFGRTELQYEKTASVSDVISKVVIALVMGYYTVVPLEQLNYAALIWNAMQASIFLALGITKEMKSYHFITGEWRGRIVKKTNNLEAFYNYVNNGGGN